MKKYIQPVTAAKDDNVSELMSTLDALNDDFDYIVASLEKLDRSGSELSAKGNVIAQELLTTFQDTIGQIADILA